jgi:hypothetical protein
VPKARLCIDAERQDRPMTVSYGTGSPLKPALARGMRIPNPCSLFLFFELYHQLSSIVTRERDISLSENTRPTRCTQDKTRQEKGNVIGKAVIVDMDSMHRS